MTRDEKLILEDILETITGSETPDQSLDRIVRMIAARFAIDVCSVYVYDPYGNSLTLTATVGLSRESVGSIEMDVSEGLTGMAIETMSPVFIKNPAVHPRYKYYPGSGEEAYQTFLGIPLIYHKKVIGALVVQTLTQDGIKEEDVPLFENIAGQIAATVAYAMLQADRRKTAAAFPRQPPPQQSLPPNHLRGEPVSDLTASGDAHIMASGIDFDQIREVRHTDAGPEIERLEKAFAIAAAQIKEVAGKARNISDQEKAIIEAHLMFLSDKSLRRKITLKIKAFSGAEYALKQVIMDYAEMFKSMDDPYLSERSSDILDIGRRVLANLVGIGESDDQAFSKDTIIVASDLSPVDLLAIRQPNLKGIVLSKGARTSHTVIMARSLEIPIVIGVENLFGQVRSGDFLIVDGVSGMVYVNPSVQIREKYARREKENQRILKKQEGLRDLSAVTLDGMTVRMGANIGLLSDMMLARRYGADHIGLYRTEFPFLLRKSFPSEDEQTALYTRVLEKAEGRSVTIRTFDVGGDKFLSYMEYPKEDNPFLGWRAIRLSLDLEDIFRTQIRAILRASATGKTKMLFPMITSTEEIRRAAALVAEEKETLDRFGIPYDRKIELGIMVEVPAAVPILDRLLRYADFVNVGTNDLMQYLLAVDRNNKKVAGRFNALHPSVIATVRDIISVCRKLEKQVCICGEAAAVRESIFLFMGMGADHLSMVPSAIPMVKQFIRSINRVDAETALKTCLEMEDAGEIASYVKTILPPP